MEKKNSVFIATSLDGYIADKNGEIDGENGCVTRMRDEVTWAEEQGGMLQTIYKDGKLLHEVTLSEIRALMNAQVKHEKMEEAVLI